MKILSYSTYFYPYISGVTVYQQRIWNRLARNHKITVLTFPSGMQKAEMAIDPKIDIRKMQYLLKVSKGFISPKSVYEFWKESKRHDVVVLNLPNFEAFPLALFAKIFRKKVIAIFQCEVDLGPGLVSKVIQFFLTLSMEIQLALSDKIIMLPGYIKKSRLGNKYKDKVIEVIPPIEELYVNNNKYQKYIYKKGNQKWIGFFGRIAREKGIEHLVKAVEKIKATNNNIQLILVGPSGSEVVGENEYHQKIQNLLKEKNIPHKTFGLVDEKEVGALIKSLDVLVLPSTNRTEAFGMVQAEAMLLGVPVVASNMPGVSFAISATQMGELAQPGDPKDLAQKIQKVLQHKEKYLKKKELLNKYFNADNSAKIIEKIITGEVTT
jgi:glycosyltransferase involved in cell wall biosynthesis